MTRTLEYACDESQFEHFDTSHLLLAAATTTAAGTGVTTAYLFTVRPVKSRQMSVKVAQK